jgi:hypothetical protein
MNRKIKWITEAFSMQPNSKCVAYGSRYDFEVGKHPILEIKEQGDYYNGYDKEGDLLFSWIAKAINVDYFAEGEWSELVIKEDNKLPI